MLNKAAIISIAIFLFSACSPAVTPEPTLDVGAVQTAAAGTFVADLTKAAPTNTPPPTNTPLPTATSTPAPQPILLSGTGSNVVDFQKWNGPAVLYITHVGVGNFAVRNYPATGGDYYDLLVNTIGPYEGMKPLDWFDDEQTARFEVIADGQWEIRVLPLDLLPVEQVPSTFQESGDLVVGLRGGSPDLLKIDASQASRNFAIHTFSSNGKDLVVNEIAPYTGTVIIDSSTFALVITATGPWSIEVTAR